MSARARSRDVPSSSAQYPWSSFKRIAEDSDDDPQTIKPLEPAKKSSGSPAAALFFQSSSATRDSRPEPLTLWKDSRKNKPLQCYKTRQQTQTVLKPPESQADAKPTKIPAVVTAKSSNTVSSNLLSSSSTRPVDVVTKASVQGKDLLVAPSRQSGVQTVHEGRPGKWRCFSSPTCTGQEEWYFFPDNGPSRKTRRKAKKKAAVTFLSLPGEIRNQIYELVVPKSRIVVRCNRVKQDWSPDKPRPRHLSCDLDAEDDDEDDWPGLWTACDLLLTCKQVRADMELYLYARTTFCFPSVKVIRKFLETASKPGMRAIKKVEILHEGYAEPENTNDRIWCQKYYTAWSETCLKFGKSLTGLEHLKLDIQVHQWPFDFTRNGNANNLWREACLRMAPERIQKVEVKLFHRMIHRNDRVLGDLARRLEDDMMTDWGRDERDRLETVQVLKQIEDQRLAAKALKEKIRRRRALASKPACQITITKEDLEKHQQNSQKSRVAGVEDSLVSKPL